MPVDITKLVLQHKGETCSVHYDPAEQIVQLQWARTYADLEGGELMPDAAVPGEPYGVQFEGIEAYKSDNHENLQVADLEDFQLAFAQPRNHCRIQLDPNLIPDLGGAVQFDFINCFVLITPRNGNNGPI
jgi:hypothetical protein